MDQQNYLQICT